ncbi:MAG: hypothetical protein AVDCRST_MAG69-627 [uncultured Solirubrobacteraceae bacterium]|uniref:Uncharacterized protein n=1 Tax=uncultured Solirubrobacteraceae bacterium TaxID=1162706 RepID=A0A6J4RYK9_9ACTN|nr:MAG: hypothetical protein AVDCRST_MAG69-627 [uncultured Solirubrobacteraceae bacterium]
MPSVLAPFSIPLRLLNDVRSIADSLAALPALIDELVTLSGRLGAMQEDLRGLREELLPLPASITQMGGELGGLRGDFASLPGTIDRLAVDLGEVLVNVRPMDTDLSKVETAVRALGPQLASIRDELDRLREDLSRLPFIGKS